MGFVPFTFIDLIDIVLVALIMYWIYRMTKGTNAPYILSGIIAVYLLWVVVRALNMELLSTILGQLISVGAIALIIVFQPELRRFLQMIGMRQKHFNFITRIFSTGDDTVETNVSPIVTACREMAETKTGALIVIGQQSDLRLIAEGGIALDAKVSTPLLKNIFFKNAPLHDGAVVIEGDRIVNATSPTITAQCLRVPVSDGHTAAVFVSFENKPSKEEILKAWADFSGEAQALHLPSAPKQFLHYFEENDRPQPKLDRMLENGMAVSVGRLREDILFDYKFVCLSHNTLRGAAGGAVLMAELLAAKGWLD